MKEITFYKSSLEDIPNLLKIESSVIGSKTYSTMLEKEEWVKAIQDGPVYIIKEDDKIIGYVSYELKSKDNAYISGIIILPEFQGKGIARKAMEYILNEIGKVKRVDLVTHPDNFKAISLYESLGFKIESRKENYFGDGEPRVVMSLLSE